MAASVDAVEADGRCRAGEFEHDALAVSFAGCDRRGLEDVVLVIDNPVVMRHTAFLDDIARVAGAKRYGRHLPADADIAYFLGICRAVRAVAIPFDRA